MDKLKGKENRYTIYDILDTFRRSNEATIILPILSSFPKWTILFSFGGPIPWYPSVECVNIS